MENEPTSEVTSPFPTGLALALTGTFEAPVLTESVSIVKSRDEAIAAAKVLPAILKEKGDVEKALEVQRAGKAVVKDVELAQKALKGPIDALGKSILRKAETFLSDLLEQLTQVTGKINNFQTRQIEASKQAVAAAERQQLAKAGEVEEAIREKADLELAMGGMAEGSPEYSEAAERMLELELIAEEAPARVASVALASTPIAIKGLSGGEEWDFRLKGNTDDEQWKSLCAFVQAFPEMCKIELRVRDIRHRLNKGDKFQTTFPEEGQVPPDYTPKPPGLIVFRNVKTRTR